MKVESDEWICIARGGDARRFRGDSKRMGTWEKANRVGQVDGQPCCSATEKKGEKP